MVNVSPHGLVCRDALTLPDNTHAPLRNRRRGRDEDEVNDGWVVEKERENRRVVLHLFFFFFFSRLNFKLKPNA